MIAQQLARLPGVRRLTRLPSAHRLAAAFTRSSVVQDRARFILRELSGSREVATYRLRSSPVRFCVRHSTPDLYTLDQVFVQRLFDLPAPVADVLQPHAASLGAADLGANIGLFGVHLLERFPGANIVAFEPDPANASILSRCIAANDGLGDWRLVQACASTGDGRLPFRAGDFGISHVAETGEAGSLEVAAVDVFPRLADVHLVKIDIEGAEWALLEDPRFFEIPARAIHLEYHVRMCPETDARARATQVLKRAGFSWLPVVHAADGNGIVWAWRL